MRDRKSEIERCAAAAKKDGDSLIGVVMFADGPIAVNELENSSFTEDWLIGDPPSAGLWIWEGYGWFGSQGFDGEWSDPSLHGKWRRPKAMEAWAMIHGRNPWQQPERKDGE